MSTRPASPPPVARWPFVLGDVLCVAVAVIALLGGESPPGIAQMMIFTVSIAAGIALLIVPFLKEHEARVRIAEALARDHVEAQLRSLKQTTEQLTNAISRGQSTEEQAGQALGTIEELAEKLNTQADELAQALARSNEREINALKADVERLVHERDDRLAGLDQRLDTVTGQLSEHQLAARKATAATSKTLDEVKERMIALAARINELTPSPHGPTPGSPAILPTPNAPTTSTPGPASESVSPPVTQVEVTVREEVPKSEPKSTTEPEPDQVAAARTTAVSVEPATRSAVAPHVAHSKPRVRRAPAPPQPQPAAITSPAATVPVSRIPSKPEPLELPLDMSATHTMVHRDGSGGTSTLVATAYIGIGNKLYVRGDGPGLSWEQGVPMQFLAIGKWGWTSPEADEPITCRIYRNDETPMLDDNIVIAPGAKAEVTPRF